MHNDEQADSCCRFLNRDDFGIPARRRQGSDRDHGCSRRQRLVSEPTSRESHHAQWCDYLFHRHNWERHNWGTWNGTSAGVYSPSNDITIGPDNTQAGTTNAIARLTTSGAITEFPLPTKAAQPLGIAAGNDGAIWFAEFKASKIESRPPAQLQNTPLQAQVPGHRESLRFKASAAPVTAASGSRKQARIRSEESTSDE
ncbi:MAG: virginiamycin B lyase family protein [Vulcanimicrobiaceae bacterium]